MIEQQGRVHRLDDGIAEVWVGAVSGCAACDAGKGCGAGVFGKLLRRSPGSFRVENTLQAVPGSQVTLGIPESAFLLLVMRLYGLPIVAGLVGAAFGHYLGTYVFGFGVSAAATWIDGLALSGGIVGLFLSGWLTRRSQPSLTGFAELRMVALIPDRPDAVCGGRP